MVVTPASRFPRRMPGECRFDERIERAFARRDRVPLEQMGMSIDEPRKHGRPSDVQGEPGPVVRSRSGRRPGEDLDDPIALDQDRSVLDRGSLAAVGDIPGRHRMRPGEDSRVGEDQVGPRLRWNRRTTGNHPQREPEEPERPARGRKHRYVSRKAPRISPLPGASHYGRRRRGHVHSGVRERVPTLGFWPRFVARRHVRGAGERTCDESRAGLIDAPSADLLPPVHSDYRLLRRSGAGGDASCGRCDGRVRASIR